MSDRDIVAELTAEHDDLLARTARAIVWAQTQPEGAEDPHMRWMLRQIEAMSDYVVALAGRIRALKEKEAVMSRWDHLAGRTVVYTPAPGIVPGDEGVVTSANDRFVFVRFGAAKLSKACYPGSLVLLSGERVKEMDV